MGKDGNGLVLYKYTITARGVREKVREIRARRSSAN
jgi:hypothetical protein